MQSPFISPSKYGNLKKNSLLYIVWFVVGYTFFFVSPSVLCAQDTLSVYFPSAEYCLPAQEAQRLRDKFMEFDAVLVDSVLIFGFADSVGNVSANYTLSKQRAEQTINVITPLLNDSVKSSFFANGESNGLKNNRRVDVLVFYHEGIAELSDSTSEQEMDNKPQTATICYQTDYDLLRNAHVSALKFEGRRYIQIEIPTQLLQRKSKTDHFYFSAKTQNVVRLTWKRKNTGKRWWSASRYVVMIPEEDYRTNKVLKRSLPPCEACAAKSSDLSIQKARMLLMADRFLQKNIQLKPLLWKRNKIAVRVPQDYVNLSDKYYYGCDTVNAIKWKVKKGQDDYLYTKLKVSERGVENICRFMEQCEDESIESDCGVFYTKLKGYREMYKGPQLIGEAAWKNKQNILSTFIGGGIGKEWELFRSDVLLGVNTERDKQIRMQGQYFWLLFPLSNRGVFPTWKKPDRIRLLKLYGRSFVGSTAYLSFPKLGDTSFFQDFHIGFSIINADKRAVLPNIYFQAATGYDHTTGKGTGFCFEIGTIMRFWNMF